MHEKMTMQPDARDTFNCGVVCDVTNCKYHSEGHKCTAEQIMVGPSFAISSADTICATFKNK